MRAIWAVLVAFPAWAETPVFVDETVSSGLVSVYAGDWQYMVGGGVSAFDCNADLLPDLVLAGGEGEASVEGAAEGCAEGATLLAVLLLLPHLSANGGLISSVVPLLPRDPNSSFHAAY